MARRRLAETFGVASVDAFGSFTDAEAIAALLAVDYVRATQAGTLPRLARPAPQGRTGLLAMDASTRASLEIHRARDGGVLHTLFGTVQRTLTPAGARLLAGWLAAPLTDPAEIAARQDAWAWMVAEREAAGRLRAALRTAPDIARALGRLSVGRGGPRDLAALRDGLRAAQAAAAALGEAAGETLGATWGKRQQGQKRHSSEGQSSQVRQYSLPLPLREGVGGRGSAGRHGPLPPTPSRKGRGRFLYLFRFSFPYFFHFSFPYTFHFHFLSHFLTFHPFLAACAPRSIPRRPARRPLPRTDADRRPRRPRTAPPGGRQRHRPRLRRRTRRRARAA